tara:strand:- start:2023 stop:2487 length:465 start_codon:yes stop_codon:yes gene_type:complete
MLRLALTTLEIEDRHLAEDLAVIFISDIESDEHWNFLYDPGAALGGLGSVFASLQGELRSAALRTMRDSIGDRELYFMPTSGMESPYQHHGHEALAYIARFLTIAEVESIARPALAARRRAEQAGEEESDILGLYERLEKSLATRRATLKRIPE